jgi:hypothetical protein
MILAMGSTWTPRNITNNSTKSAANSIPG